MDHKTVSGYHNPGLMSKPEWKLQLNMAHDRPSTLEPDRQIRRF
jgi:hypothetical protein